MSDQQNRSTERSNGNGCLLPIMFLVAILLSIIVGGVAGSAINIDRQTTIYPVMTVAPQTLYVAPTPQTYAAPATNDCDSVDPTAPVAGWEKGVGGQLPPCYAEWDRIKQNQFLRSH